MEWLESLGLLGLFLGSVLAASIVPFSSDVLYIAVLATTGQDRLHLRPQLPFRQSRD